ncbi:MAG: pantoate--beta-alanine ligase, partial [bacterium]|nr:pantoate--beta-alanine ligase [bacterium]
MLTARSVKKMQSAVRQLARKGKTIGLVPTMGYLHEGHLSLVRKAAKAADVVVTTIFANPTQFGPKEDFKKYPRDEKGDIKKIASALRGSTTSAAFKQSIVFIPKVDDVYPDDFQTWVTVEKLTKKLEGARRPEHFRGVTTIVAKLFNIIRPDVAFFGMKDFQQAVVLKQMVRDLGFPTKIVIAPTVREADGLAMSSRNAYLDEKGRWEAICLYYALRSAKEMIKAGVSDCKKIEREMRAVIKATCRT